MAANPKRRAAGTTQKFLDYAKPNEEGWTEVVSLNELNSHYDTDEFTTKNGGSWCRSDSSLLSRYNVERIQGSGADKSGRRIIAVQLKGLKESASNRGIRSDIRTEITAQKCAILCNSSDIQVDHKCPRLALTPRVMDLKTQELTDFQALCRAANAAKRGHCNKCGDSKTRFDAKVLGYTVSYWRGGPKANDGCVGCYWYDPVEFNHQVSKDYTSSK